MSNRAKLLLSVLFIAAIILTIGLTRFYFDVTKNNVKTDSNDAVESIVQSFGDMQVFRNESGYCGVVNAEGTVVIEPEWMEILDITSNLVLVSRRMNNVVLIGGIDYEENVVLPFVYKSFTPLGESYLAAEVEADGSCIIYDRSYTPVFFSSYDDAAFEKGVMELTVDSCRFSYGTDAAPPVLRRAEMQCRIGSQALNWRVSNQVYLSDLRESDLRRMNQSVAAYMDMLLEDDFTELASISSAEFISGLSKPGSMPGALIDRISSFSLSKEDEQTYNLAFTAAYHMTGDLDSSQSVQVQLFFRRGAENDMLLTSAKLDFQRKEQHMAKPEPPDEEHGTEPTDLTEPTETKSET